MKVEEIKNLARLLEKGTLTEINWREGDSHIILKKEGNPVFPSEEARPAQLLSAPGGASSLPTGQIEEKALYVDDGLHVITSPMVGTYYHSPTPEDPAYVKVGDRIRKGQVLCIIEAMKLMNEIESEVSGIVQEICSENEMPVEYGAALFRIKPD
jgi:acetyl-CoA carboxylase biotin carboxyl carrier protein